MRLAFYEINHAQKSKPRLTKVEGLAEASGSELPQLLLTKVYELNPAVFF